MRKELIEDAAILLRQFYSKEDGDKLEEHYESLAKELEELKASQPSPQVPEGYALVPDFPEMVFEGDFKGQAPESWDEDYKQIWIKLQAASANKLRLHKYAKELRSMLQASPSAEQPQLTDGELLPCPFCGEIPETSGLGTQVDLACCISMSIQKSDYLTLEERKTWSNKTHSYCAEAEAKAFAVLVDKWNTRALLAAQPTGDKP